MKRYLNRVTGYIYTGDPPIGQDEIYCIELPADGMNYEPIEDEPFYQLRSVDLSSLKAEKITSNQKALTEKLTIITSKGELSLKTPVGDLSIAIMGLLMLELPLYSNVLRTSSDEYLPDMNLDEFKAFYLEIVQKYQAIDSKHTEIKNNIENASTEEELNNILIDYSNI